MNATIAPLAPRMNEPAPGELPSSEPESTFAQGSGSHGDETSVTCASRLLISLRSGAQAPADGWGKFGRVLMRLRSLVPGKPAPSPQSPTSVQIDDLPGENFLRIDRCPPAIDIRLPPGTYHVTACRHSALRRYTVTLGQGATVRLRLHMPPHEGSQPGTGGDGLSQSHTDQASA